MIVYKVHSVRFHAVLDWATVYLSFWVMGNAREQFRSTAESFPPLLSTISNSVHLFRAS